MCSTNMDILLGQVLQLLLQQASKHTARLQGVPNDALREMLMRSAAAITTTLAFVIVQAQIEHI